MLYFHIFFNDQKSLLAPLEEGSFLARHDEIDILFPVVFEPVNQLIVTEIKGDPLDCLDIKHVGKAGIPDGEDLLADQVSHSQPPPS